MKQQNIGGVFEFSAYCASCQRFGYNSCPNLNKVDGLTRWESVNCTKFLED